MFACASSLRPEARDMTFTHLDGRDGGILVTINQLTNTAEQGHEACGPTCSRDHPIPAAPTPVDPGHIFRADRQPTNHNQLGNSRYMNRACAAVQQLWALGHLPPRLGFFSHDRV